MLKKIAVLAIAAVYLSGCTTTDPYTGEQKMSNTAGGALIGAGLGAATGLLVGGSAAGRRDAALVGAGIGALGGGLIGNYMDSQETELRAQLQNTGVSVTRVGDRIVLNMPENITFATDQDQMNPRAYPTLNSVAIVLRKFNKTLDRCRWPHRFDRQRQPQPGSFGTARHLGCQLSRLAGRRPAPHVGRRLRSGPADRIECQPGRTRAEPPRRNLDRADQAGLILSLIAFQKAGPCEAAGFFRAKRCLEAALLPKMDPIALTQTRRAPLTRGALQT